MKKSLATLLAAILLLACIPALADEAPTARTHFAELGLDVDITAITDKCVYTASVETEGILSLDPYIAMADVYYCALPQKQLLELKEIPHKRAACLAVPFPPCTSCKFLDLPPASLRNLQARMT